MINDFSCILRFKKLDPDAILPEKATTGSVGLDICAIEDVSIRSGEITVVGTGLSVQIPTDYELQVRPRSGLAAKFGVTVVNAPGTIDSDYRGEIKVILTTLKNRTVEIKKGARIAQLVPAQVCLIEVLEVEELEETDRGEGGLGSTGE